MEEEDLEIILECSDDQRELTLTFKSLNKIELSDFVLALEQYLMELSRAEEQRIGVETH